MATRTTLKDARARKAAFLRALAETHLVTEAAKHAGVHRATFYEWRKEDEEFARAWAEVEERSTEGLELEAVQRAHEGSDVLLMFLLKARRPDVYREYRQVQHVGHDGGPVGVTVNLSAKTRQALSDALRERPAKRD